MANEFKGILGEYQTAVPAILGAPWTNMRDRWGRMFARAVKQATRVAGNGL